MGLYAMPMEGQELLSFFSEEVENMNALFYSVFLDMISYLHVLQ